MLYSPTQFNREQLLEDLLALRQRLESPGSWVKNFGDENNTFCMVAAAEKVTDQHIAFYDIPQGNEDPKLNRLGRMIVYLYKAIYGPKAPTNITVSAAMSKIAAFNDDYRVNHEVVLLAIDRAIQACLETTKVVAD